MTSAPQSPGPAAVSGPGLPASRASLRAYPEIDGIRGVLSMIVLSGHVLILAHWPEIYADGQSPMFWYWGSMEIFFCISGFLITRNLLLASATQVQWVRYYLIKRALRIWPAYYAALALTLAMSMVVAQDAMQLRWNRDWLYLLKTVFFLQNTEFYFGGNAAGMVPLFRHSWSVALEEQFYMLLLLFLWLRARTGLFAGGRALLPLILLLPLSQFLRHLEWSGSTLLGRSEGFLCGIILAFLEPFLQSVASRLRRGPPVPRQICIYALCVLALVPLLPYLWVHGYWDRVPQIMRIGPFNPYFAYSFLAMVFLATIVISPSTFLHRILRWAPLRYLGEISYSTYLFHIPAIYGVYFLLAQHAALDPWFLVLAPLCALGLSSLTYRCIERPFLQMKRNYA